MNMNTSEIQDLFDDYFNCLDRVVEDRLPDRDQKHRGAVVMAFPELDRDLYFICDVIAITCNAGMGAWIDYHINDSGWIDDAARAFEAIGHGEIGRSLKECRERYIAADGDFESWDDKDLSKKVWNSEEQLEKDLYEHLLASGFSFRQPPLR